MTVFYRKYRPQKISEIDSEEVKNRISLVLSSDRIPHAFLLIGPRGLGKTSTARIITKSVNCLNKKTGGEPCGECEQCITIKDGTNLDVIEMDAASNRGIDEIRDLRDKVKLSPSHAKYKVYIIDEVHMLTNEAFNALLKTLEEPPSHAIFILCTTESNKIPETIISRCVVYEFKYPSISEIVNSLKRTKKGEKLEMEDGVLELIAEKSKGSFRDAQKILDQLSFTNDLLTKEMVLSLSGSNLMTDDLFLKSLLEKNTKEAISWLSRKIADGLDCKLFIEDILEILHAEFVSRFSSDFKNKKQLLFLNNLTDENLKELINLFSKAYLELKSAVIQELPVEMAIVEWGESENQISKITHALLPYRINSASKTQSQIDETNTTEKKVKERAEVDGGKNIPVATVEIKKDVQVYDENKAVIKKQEVLGKNLTTEDVVNMWPRVLSGVKSYNHSVEALLRSSRPIGCDGDCFNIEVFYKFHKERLEEPKVFELLSKVIDEVFGSNLKLKYFLGEKKKQIKAVEEKNDLVSQAEEIFGG